VLRLSSVSIIIASIYVRTLNIDEPLARIEADGTVRYYHADALGSVTALTDSSGAVQTRYRYESFGKTEMTLDDGHGATNPFRYTGRELDETGAYYYRARYYNAEVGRFISEDPLGFAGRDVNLYAYVWNRPALLIDPLGLDGIYVSYRGYPVNTGYGFKLPLGHAAVIAVDPETGTTKYYEYGRYGGDFGKVRNQWVPDLVMRDGKPTAESLENLYNFISQNYGHGRPVDAKYYSDADFQKIVDFAVRRMTDENRRPYSILNNNCKTFAQDAIDAGRN
jgi:RHS repeat-associated protein